VADVYIILCFVSAYALALLVGARQKSVLPWLLLGVTLRVLMLVMDIADLWEPPNSTADARGFIHKAHSLAALPWRDILTALDYRSASSYAVSGAVLFKSIGFHPYGMQATNVLAGTVNMILATMLVRRYVNPTAATGAAVLLCLYPFAAFNSVVALREEFGILFFLLGLVFLLRWTERGSIVPFFVGNGFFVFASFVHPGFIAAAIAATGFFVVSSIKSLKGRGDRRSAMISALVGLAMFLGSAGVLVSGVELGKGMELTLDPDEIAETIESKFQRDSMGGSAYPSAIAQGDPFTRPWLVPARMIYFLYSPFIWDVRSLIHLGGLLVGLFYIWLSLRAWRGWRSGLLGGRKRVLGWMFALLTFVFAMGVTNSGTAIRHKTKFFPLLVMLAAPTFRRRVIIGRSAGPDAASVLHNRFETNR
jgi:hypothetical protein